MTSLLRQSEKNITTPLVAVANLLKNKGANLAKTELKCLPTKLTSTQQKYQKFADQSQKIVQIAQQFSSKNMPNQKDKSIVNMLSSLEQNPSKVNQENTIQKDVFGFDARALTYYFQQVPMVPIPAQISKESENESKFMKINAKDNLNQSQYYSGNLKDKKLSEEEIISILELNPGLMFNSIDQKQKKLTAQTHFSTSQSLKAKNRFQKSGLSNNLTNSWLGSLNLFAPAQPPISCRTFSSMPYKAYIMENETNFPETTAYIEQSSTFKHDLDDKRKEDLQVYANQTRITQTKAQQNKRAFSSVAFCTDFIPETPSQNVSEQKQNFIGNKETSRFDQDGKVRASSVEKISVSQNKYQQKRSYSTSAFRRFIFGDNAEQNKTQHHRGLDPNYWEKTPGAISYNDHCGVGDYQTTQQVSTKIQKKTN